MKAYVMLAVSIVAQVQQPHVLPHAQMSRGFTTCALGALKEIDRYTGAPEQDSPDKIIASESVVHALDDADNQARSRSEVKAMTLLKTYLEDRIHNNLERDVLVLDAQNEWMVKHKDDWSEEFEAQAMPAVKLLTLSRSPEIQTMNRREAACSTGLESMLRSGAYRNPAACLHVSE